MFSIRQALVAAIAFTAFSAFNAFAAVEANQASPTELQTVRGIGPSLSTKIVQARKTAAFKNWTDMVERVQGVGPASAARLSQAGLTVAGATFTPAAKTAEVKPVATRATSAAPAATTTPARSSAQR